MTPAHRQILDMFKRSVEYRRARSTSRANSCSGAAWSSPGSPCGRQEAPGGGAEGGPPPAGGAAGQAPPASPADQQAGGASTGEAGR
jgi:hypothetical protein